MLGFSIANRVDFVWEQRQGKLIGTEGEHFPKRDRNLQRKNSFGFAAELAKQKRGLKENTVSYCV